MIPGLSVWLADEIPSTQRGRVMGGLTSALFLGVFASPIAADSMSAASGTRGVCLSAGALLPLMASLLWVTRGQLSALTGAADGEVEIHDTDVDEAGVGVKLEKLDVVPSPKDEAGRCAKHAVLASILH